MSGLVLIAGGTVFACAAGFYLRGRTVRSPRAVLGGVLAVLAVLLAASLATGLACLGAGIAVAVVGAAALGVVGEKPSMLGTTLIYLGLAEGIAIYGVIVSLLILGKL